MIQFYYQAQDTFGKMIQGKMYAKNVCSVQKKLQSKAFILNRCIPMKSKKKACKLSVLNLLCEKLVMILESGLPFVKGFFYFTEGIQDKRIKVILVSVGLNIMSGMSLSEALLQCTDRFPALFIQLIKAAETGVSLKATMSYLGEYYKNEQIARQKGKLMLIYPLFLSILLLIISGVLFFTILPSFQKLFQELNTDVPPFTRMIFHLSTHLQANGALILCGTAIIISMGIICMRTSKGVYLIDSLRLRFPIYKRIYRYRIISNLSHTWFLLIQDGVAMVTTLELLANHWGNRVLKAKFQTVISLLLQGNQVSYVLGQMHYFPLLFLEMIACGEKMGDIAAAFHQAATYYDNMLKASYQKIHTLLEPCMLIIIAGAVALIGCTIYIPMIDYLNKIGSG